MQLKTLNIIYKTNERRLKVKRRQTSYGPCNSRNHTVVSLLFLLHHIPHGQGTEEARNPEMQKGRIKQSPCSFKGPGKEQHSKTEIFYAISSVLQQKNRKKTVAYPNLLQQMPNRDPIPSVSPGYASVWSTPTSYPCRGNIEDKTLFPARWK